MTGPLIYPFKALRPTRESCQQVVAPPYDVINESEARQIFEDNRDSFISVSRPEVTFENKVNPYLKEVYEKGRSNLERLILENKLIKEQKESFYIYQISHLDHVQNGFGVVGSIKGYIENKIRKHELTRPEKELDRVNNIDHLNAQTGPVLGVFKDDAILEEITKQTINNSAPDLECRGPNNTHHKIWILSEESMVQRIYDQFSNHKAIYIADGHHRSAAAARVFELRNHQGVDNFLMVIFPESEMKIFDYNRVIHLDHEFNLTSILEKLNKNYEIIPVKEGIKPNEPYMLGLYAENQWYQLNLKNSFVLPKDPVKLLDVSILQSQILSPLFGVEDPRTDNRLNFVGGVRGIKGVEDYTNSKPNGIGFTLFPTSMRQLMDVADAELLMPPKSTWFEPKLVDGLLTNTLD